MKEAGLATGERSSESGSVKGSNEYKTRMVRDEALGVGRHISDWLPRDGMSHARSLLLTACSRSPLRSEVARKGTNVVAIVDLSPIRILVEIEFAKKTAP